MTAMTLGKKIGQGMTAEVFEAGDGRVVKLFREGASQDGVRYEAKVGKAVHAAGVPSPALYGELEFEGRQGLLYERIPGVSMQTMLVRRPLQIARFGRDLARLHFSVHAHESTDLPTQRDRLIWGIRKSADVLGDRVDRVMAHLDGLPLGITVCHGDFHADNILMEGRRAVPIDWTNACSGNAAADVARSVLMLRSPYIPPEIPALLAVMATDLKRSMLDAYLKEYLKLSPMRFDEIEQFMVPVAAARIQEGIPGEREWLLDLVDEGLTEKVG